jgi:hypothetical protein
MSELRARIGSVRAYIVVEVEGAAEDVGPIIERCARELGQIAADATADAPAPPGRASWPDRTDDVRETYRADIKEEEPRA